MEPLLPDYYAVLGLDRSCTVPDIRSAYRSLARQFHPDLNGRTPGAVAQTQAINAAYEVLSDPVRRRAYDLDRPVQENAAGKGLGLSRDMKRDIHISLCEFFRGTRLEIRLHDPGPGGASEIHELIVPPGTAPGTHFKLARQSGGFLTACIKPRPDYRFKVRGFDLRCDLKLHLHRAGQGGCETMRGPMNNLLRIQIPPDIKRGGTIRVTGEGLPRPRGGRGDLLVRVIYVPVMRIRRLPNR